MNWLEQLRRLDPRDVGRWPLAFRIAAIGLVFVVAACALVYLFVWTGNVPALDKAKAEQKTLWSEFEEKQAKAANLEAYKQQLAEIEQSFGAMLRQLPGRTEVPNLLVDISQTGLGAGLRERLFQPGSESRKDFYAELPITIRLTGGYHEMGKFASGIAALPRIVTLHDIEIQPSSQVRGAAADPGSLTLNVTAKTYRYLDEDDQAKATGKGKKGKKPAKKG